ncbi:uncharacterized protein LOC135681848 [Rhopilema esculentum]|uniref:uncharacterized protein LOC135681848 n=1 Tax=Rhopilema esculentum TaxID=499914 RepID=UPI0031DD6BDB
MLHVHLAKFVSRIRKMFLIHLLFALTFNKVMAVDNNKHSVMFEVIQNPTNEQTSMFHESFHECSRSGPCNFVAKNITTRKYYTYNKEDDIPQDRKMLIIWKRKRKYSCLDWRYDSAMVNGIYRISDDDGVEFNVYCDFTSEPNSVWTLIESFSLDKNNMFKNKPFKIDFSYSEDSPNWGSYRLSKTRIEKLKLRSTHWRATCSFDVFGVDYRDYVRFKLSAFDPLCCFISKAPIHVELVNIRGYSATEQLVDFWQDEGEHLNIDSEKNVSFLQAKEGSVKSEDNFGLYEYQNSAFRCTANSSSTTQHWIGTNYP